MVLVFRDLIRNSEFEEFGNHFNINFWMHESNFGISLSQISIIRMCTCSRSCKNCSSSSSTNLWNKSSLINALNVMRKNISYDDIVLSSIFLNSLLIALEIWEMMGSTIPWDWSIHDEFSPNVNKDMLNIWNNHVLISNNPFQRHVPNKSSCVGNVIPWDTSVSEILITDTFVSVKKSHRMDQKRTSYNIGISEIVCTSITKVALPLMTHSHNIWRQSK